MKKSFLRVLAAARKLSPVFTIILLAALGKATGDWLSAIVAFGGIAAISVAVALMDEE